MAPQTRPMHTGYTTRFSTVGDRVPRHPLKGKITMKYLFFLAATVLMACGPTSVIPAGIDIGPAPNQAQMDQAVTKWVATVSLPQPGKLVVQDVHLVGPRAWVRSWNDNRVTGKGEAALPPPVGSDYGWEIAFTATTTNNDGVTTRKMPQAILMAPGMTPRGRQFIQ